MADLLTDLKTKLYDLEAVIAEWEVKASESVGEDRDYNYWYLGLRVGQQATFQFVISKLEDFDVLDRYAST